MGMSFLWGVAEGCCAPLCYGVGSERLSGRYRRKGAMIRFLTLAWLPEN